MFDSLMSYQIWIELFFMIYFGIINFIYLLFFIIGSVGLIKRFHRFRVDDHTSVLQSNCLPEITFVIPTYNDSKFIMDTINNIRFLTYRHKKILIVNDGSIDNTLDLLKKNLNLFIVHRYFFEKLPTKKIRGIYKSHLHPEITVIDKENGEKFDAINVALNACETNYFAIVDSDTFIDDDEFESLVRPIFADPDTIAIGAAVKIANECELVENRVDTSKFPQSFLVGIQAVEYLRSFLMRTGWESIRNNYIISGAFGVFIRDVVIQAGGYAPTVANDLEIILRLDRIMRATKTPYKIVYRPDPVAWTKVPDNLKDLEAQRLRWHRGLMESLWFNKVVAFNPRYGLQGLLVHPFLIFFETFEPLVEFLGYLYIIIGLIVGFVSWDFIILFFAVTIGFTFIQTLIAFIIDEFSFRNYSSFRSISMLFGYALLENFGYRQMNVYWRIKGFFSFFNRFDEVKRDSKVLNQKVKQTIKKGIIPW